MSSSAAPRRVIRWAEVEPAAENIEGSMLAEIADQFLAAKADTHARHTRRGHAYGRKLITKYADRRLVEWTAATAQRVYDTVVAEHGVHTANRLAKLASASWTYAAQRGQAPTLNPWRLIDRPRQRVRPLYFDAGWLPAMLRVVDRAIVADAVPVYAGRFLALALATGARPWQELLPLRVEDLDFGGGVILVRKAKGGQPRAIPTAILGSVGLRILRAQAELVGSGWLWPSPRRGRGRGRGRVHMSDGPPREAWPLILERAEAAGLRTTTLDGKRLDLYAASRHAVANFAVSQLGLSVAHVAAILGHRSEECLQTYAHLCPIHATPTAKAIGDAYDETRMDHSQDGTWGVDALALRSARDAAGLTQAALGEAVGVTKQAISKWERGASSPSVAELHRIAVRLGHPVDHFFCRPPAARSA